MLPRLKPVPRVQLRHAARPRERGSLSTGEVLEPNVGRIPNHCVVRLAEQYVPVFLPSTSFSYVLLSGRLRGARKNSLWMGVGYEYWRNKFGNHSQPGVDTDAMTLNLEWHF